MKITVTKEDIDAAVPGDPYRCALARAGSRATKMRCGVGRFFIAFFENETLLSSLPLPEIAVGFSRTVDSGKPVQPFSFNLKIKP